MSRKTSSQWSFSLNGEPTPAALSVSELTSRIKRLLERDYREVRVTGEVSGLKYQPSGHAYFVLKDVGAQISCVLFRGELQVDRSVLQDGHKVVLKGQITVYEPRGTYQLRVTGLELQGAGMLQAAFEKLKEKLKTEGLFAPERKRQLPRMPRRIGLVTSPAGAAIRDVLHVVERRNPSLEIILAPCRVQGAGAAAEIARSIVLLNDYDQQQRSVPSDGKPLDLILVTRGGGSLEDLWCFNEEIVARAIYESSLPIVSGVGHEIDFTIADFVADLRAATPSAAAEIITEGVFSSCQVLADLTERLGQLVRQQYGRVHLEFTRTTQRFARAHPGPVLEARSQQIDEALSSLSRCMRQTVRRETIKCDNLSARLARVRPGEILRRRREVLSRRLEKLGDQVGSRMRELKARNEAAASRLRLLGPEQVMSRGYSITINLETGRVLRDAKEVKPGQRLKTRLKSGETYSRVERPKKGDQAELPL